MAWIYIHDKNYVSAREHIEKLPSVKEKRLQESILAQMASFEHGLEGMKSVLIDNLQTFVRAINKELLYAIKDMAWNDTPENTVDFGKWALELMGQFCKKEELIPYCRGFYRDIYLSLLQADFRMKNFELAAVHWQELCQGMEMHYQYYQEVLADEKLLNRFTERQQNYMRAYNKEFIFEKQQAIKGRLLEWNGDEASRQFADVIENVP